jgi:AraC-like DNA-binding protein
MRLPQLPARVGSGELPLWPPLLATRGPGGKSGAHAHHAMHFALAVEGTLKARAGGPWIEAAGVLTAPDLVHEIDARGCEVLLVFLDPESEVGAALVPPGLRAISGEQRAQLVGADPMELVASGVEWCRRAVRTLGATPPAGRRHVHPRVRKALRLLSADQAASLEALAAAVDLSPGRLMHVFTASIGIPLRPYLAWLKLQRAAGAIVSGSPLADAAHAAGFADAAHMTRTFRRMFGVTPSQLRPRKAAS